MAKKKIPSVEDFENLQYRYEQDYLRYLELEVQMRKLLSIMKHEKFRPDLWPAIEELLLPF